MPHSPSKGKKWIIAVLIVVCAIVLAGAALLILGGRGLSARYDDAAALLSEYDGSQTPARSVRDDGSVALRLTREDLYWYARRYGLLDDIRADLSRLGIDSAGFRLSDGKLTVYALYKTWDDPAQPMAGGFFPPLCHPRALCQPAGERRLSRGRRADPRP